MHSTLASRSGYQVLADYLSRTEFLSTVRKNPGRFLPWVLARTTARFAFTRYYLGGCAQLEWKAWKRIRKGDVGLVHMMWADHDLGFLDLFVNQKTTPICGTFHLCSDTLGQTIRFPNRLQRLAAIILMSESQRPYFLSVGVKPERIHVVLHGVDADYFTPAQHKPDGPLRVLSVGNTRRNFPLLVKVCKAFNDDPRLRFQVVASPDRRRLFEHMKNVDFLCGLSDDQLLECYRNASVLLQALENTTANNVVLEAMACGVPVVAERVGGIGEYVTSECARLASPNNVDEFVGAIKNLVDSRHAREDMGKAARFRAETLHWRHVANRTREVYETAINARRT